MIYWNGKSSNDLNVIVEYYPRRIIPARKMETETIPGRSGDVIFPQDAFENYVQPYSVYLSAARPRLPAVARQAAQWLQVPGYHKLYDSYDRDCFRLAYFMGGTDLENIFNEYGRATIEFNCMPQRFTLDGDELRPMFAPAVLVNPSEFTALPLIIIHGAGAGTLTVGSYTVSLTDCDGVSLDSMADDAYRGNTNMNPTVTGTLPKLPAGNSPVSWSGGITHIEIKPRWWTL